MPKGAGFPSRGRLSSQPTERGRLCTSTSAKQQNRPCTTDQQPHPPSSMKPKVWSCQTRRCAWRLGSPHIATSNRATWPTAKSRYPNCVCTRVPVVRQHMHDEIDSACLPNTLLDRNTPPAPLAQPGQPPGAPRRVSCSRPATNSVGAVVGALGVDVCGAHPPRTPPAPATRLGQLPSRALNNAGPQFLSAVQRRTTADTDVGTHGFDVCGAHPPRTPPAPATRPGQVPNRAQTLPGPSSQTRWLASSPLGIRRLPAAHDPSRCFASVSVHVPPAQVGAPCPRGPVSHPVAGLAASPPSAVAYAPPRQQSNRKDHVPQTSSLTPRSMKPKVWSCPTRRCAWRLGSPHIATSNRATWPTAKSRYTNCVYVCRRCRCQTASRQIQACTCIGLCPERIRSCACVACARSA